MSPLSQMSLKTYLGLFTGADPAIHLAVGDGSVMYLYSKVAVPEILKFNPEAKFIAILRNPVELAAAWHSQVRGALAEDIPDFEQAWRAQDERRLGKRIPFFCYEPKILLYSDLAKTGAQVERLLSLVPRERLKLIMFEDFASETAKVYGEVLDFLGVPRDGRTQFPKVNPNLVLTRPYLQWIYALVWRIQKTFIKAGLIKQPFKALNRLKALGGVREPRKPLSPSFRAELVEHFRQDVALLSRLLGRDLSHWLSPSEKPVVKN